MVRVHVYMPFIMCQASFYVLYVYWFISSFYQSYKIGTVVNLKYKSLTYLCSKLEKRIVWLQFTHLIFMLYWIDSKQILKVQLPEVTDV